MTDNEAIKWLNKNRPCISMTCNKENADNINIATDMAIKLLEERAQGETYTFEQVQELVKLNQQFAQEIENLKRQKGEWIKGPEISRMMMGDNVLCIDYKDYTCSNCGLVLDRLLYHVDGSPFYKFCPECGTNMIKEKENGNT